MVFKLRSMQALKAPKKYTYSKRKSVELTILILDNYITPIKIGH